MHNPVLLASEVDGAQIAQGLRYGDEIIRVPKQSSEIVGLFELG